MSHHVTLSIQLSVDLDDPNPNIVIADMLNDLSDRINYHGQEGHFHDETLNMSGFFEVWENE